MFDVSWSNRSIWAREETVYPSQDTRLNPARVEKVALLHWAEHCLECTEPTCYISCPLYLARADKKCIRCTYGLYPNPNFSSLSHFGADCRFRKWAKIESRFHTKAVKVGTYRRIDAISRLLTKVTKLLSLLLISSSLTRKLSSALTVYRERLLKRISRHAAVDFDAFVLECFAPDDLPFRLILQCDKGEVYFRHAFEIKPGHNFFEIPVQKMNLPSDANDSRLMLYPENNAERRVIFVWCDFVKYRKSRPAPASRDSCPAEKVKCVAWDLDNTLWKGTLVEDGQESISIIPEAVELIKALDERGILNTIISKNTHEQAWEIIEKYGLDEYFLCPAINWGQKSTNLRKIAERLNIHLNTFALIDDSPFERQEIKTALPMVRVYPETDILSLLDRREFDVPVTEMSRKRRHSYLVEFEREKVRGEFGKDYEAFLRSCRMELELFIPTEREAVQRCFELVQRSNQLNLSTKRYCPDEFDRLLSMDSMLCVALRCRDKFGDYGIVGFTSIDEEKGVPELVDFVISCRVAQKKVESTFIRWLANRLASRGKSAFRASLIKTGRNGPLATVFNELPFEVLNESDHSILFEMKCNGSLKVSDIIILHDKVSK